MTKKIINSPSDSSCKSVKYSSENEQVQFAQSANNSGNDLALRSWLKYVYTGILLINYMGFVSNKNL